MRIVAIISLFLLGACAGQVQPPKTKVTQVSAEQAVYLLHERNRLAKRMFRIGERVLFAGAPLCGGRTVPAIGMAVWNIHSGQRIPARLMRRAFALDEAVSVQAVGQNTPAAQAGLRPGDRLVEIAGNPVPGGPNGVAAAGKMLRAANRLRQPYVVTVRRGQRPRAFRVRPRARCAYTYGIVQASMINAFADGNRVAVTTGLMRFARTDAELAIVFGHELAHNTLGHLTSTRASTVIGSVGGTALDIALGVIGIPTFGVFSRLGGVAGRRVFSVQYEKEADYVGLYFAALAGYRLEGALDIWRRLAVDNPNQPQGLSRTHPTYAERLAAMAATVREIRAKRAAGQPLRPNRGPGADTGRITAPIGGSDQ